MASRGFPRCSDGNVEIRLSNTDEKYVLHSWTLALHSDWFMASLDPKWNTGADTTTVDGKHSWTYELWFDKDSDLGRLQRKAQTAPANMEFIEGTKGKLPAGANAEMIRLNDKRLSCIKAHQNLFSSLYHVKTPFSHASFNKAVSEIEELANLADYYQAQSIIQYPINTHLLLCRGDVDERCARTPVDMLQLASKVKMEWMFMEAATNLLGFGKTAFEAEIPRLEELEIAQLMKVKRAEFVHTLENCELALFSIQPSATRPQQQAVLAINYFRHYLANCKNGGEGSSLSAGYSTMYHDIWRHRYGGPPNIHWQGLVNYLSLFYTADERFTNEVLTELGHVLIHASQIIQPIMEDKTKRKNMAINVPLKFMTIGDDELPWAKK